MTENPHTGKSNVNVVRRIAWNEGYNQGLEDAKEQMMRWGMPRETADQTVNPLKKVD